MFATVGAGEALRVEVLPDGIQTITLDLARALVAVGSNIFLETELAVKLILLFHEPYKIINFLV